MESQQFKSNIFQIPSLKHIDNKHSIYMNL